MRCPREISFVKFARGAGAVPCRSMRCPREISFVKFARGAGAEPRRSMRCPREISFVKFSRGAGAEPLPEREVSSQPLFSFVLCRRRGYNTKTNKVVLHPSTSIGYFPYTDTDSC